MKKVVISIDISTNQKKADLVRFESMFNRRFGNRLQFCSKVLDEKSAAQLAVFAEDENATDFANWAKAIPCVKLVTSQWF